MKDCYTGQYGLINTKSPSNPAVLRMALQDPTCCRNKMPKEAQFCAIWDSGASVTVMPHTNWILWVITANHQSASGSRD
jgi:hypothetical protein